jgi:hypothetical protein
MFEVKDNAANLDGLCGGGIGGFGYGVGARADGFNCTDWAGW